jgi:hypothetical protein
MIDRMPNVAGLSGDLGWDESDEPRLNGVGSALMVTATSLYWGSLWVLAGLPPLSNVLTRPWGRRRT